MDQLGEPILVTKGFIKMLEESIYPTYEKVLQEVFEKLQKDIDSKYGRDKVTEVVKDT